MRNLPFSQAFVWLSHFLLPWTHVLHRPTRKICDPACLVLPKGSPAGVLHASHHAPPLFSGLLGFLQLVPTATFELAVGPNWQPDSSGGQRTLHFPFHRVTKLVGLSRRLRRHLGRTSRRPTQGDSASRSPALPFPLSLLRGRRAWPLSRLWAVKWPAKRMGLLSLPFSSGLTRRGRRTSADARRGGTWPLLLPGVADQCPTPTTNPQSVVGG